MPMDFSNMGQQIMDWARKEPELAGALAGGVGGAGIGGLANGWEGAALGGLGGAGLGGAAGYGAGRYMNSQSQDARDELYKLLQESTGDPDGEGSLRMAYDNREGLHDAQSDIARERKTDTPEADYMQYTNDMMAMPDSRQFNRPRPNRNILNDDDWQRFGEDQPALRDFIESQMLPAQQ